MKNDPEPADRPVETLATEQDETVELLSWKSHPSRRHPLRAVLVLLLLMLIGLFIAVYTASLFLGLLLAVVLFFSLGPFFFPTWYTLSAKGIVVRTLITRMERPWSVYRTHWPDRNGVLLSPFPRPSRLENFRGVFVRFDANREEVLALVRRFVPRGER